MPRWRAVAIACALAAGCGRTELFPAGAAPSGPDAGRGDGAADIGPESADLALLRVSAGPLSPAFAPGTLSYQLVVGALLDSTTVTATAVSPRAEVRVDGTTVAPGVPSPPLPLAVGLTVVMVSVTVPGLAPRVYAVTLERGSDIAQRAYVKASNTAAQARFGTSVAMSGDTLVVGAYGESSSGAGVNPPVHDGDLSASGAVYVYRVSGGLWTQEAFIKASNPDAGDWFGYAVAIQGDTLLVGAPHESSGAELGPRDNNVSHAGAVYVFSRSNGAWSEAAMVKSFNPGVKDSFGTAVAISGDTLAAGAFQEASAARGVDSGGEDDDSAPAAGAAYVFVRAGAGWTQQAYVKASNTGAGDLFGFALALDGDTLAVTAESESSQLTGVNPGAGADDGSPSSGAVYVFARSAGVWRQQAYVKASNTGSGDRFGSSVALSGDTLAVGATLEDSRGTGVAPAGVPTERDDSSKDSGAVYVFTRSGQRWTESSYIKPSNNGPAQHFGSSVALWGDLLGVGAVGESSAATGVAGGWDGGLDSGAPASGAAYVYARTPGGWAQRDYVKASNTGAGDGFGYPVVLSGDTLVVGASLEDSATRGVNAGSGADDGATDSGAVYVFR